MACLPLDVVLAPASGTVWVGFFPDPGWLSQLLLKERRANVLEEW